MLFVADVMLGKLARWLRLIGARVVYAKDEGTEEDDALIRLAMRRGAVLLTRDERLARKARGYARVLLVKSNFFDEQLAEVARAFKLRVPRARLPATLCPSCGGELKRVSKKSVRARVWPRVFARHKVFWECGSCAKIFWRGTHLKAINAVLHKVRARLN